MKYYLLLLFLVLSIKGFAWEERDLLQKKADMVQLKSYLINQQKWIDYPSYSDRSGWDRLTSGFKEAIIKKGEAALNYNWKVVSATDYLEFDRSGSRKIMEDTFKDNNSALTNLVLAELAEGKGRFINQIANGIWYYCEMTSWALSAHVSREQAEKTSLPSYRENIIDLASGNMGSFLAWTYYFLKGELAKIQPMIPERLHDNLQKRILDPYINRVFWWMAMDATPTTMVNNWNPWCNFNVLTCFLLLENNPDKLTAAVYRTMVSVDKYLNHCKADGACEEGPSYWYHASGKMFDYLSLLSRATGGKVSIFNEPMIKNMGEYIVNSYIGNGWVVNFADASANGGGDPCTIFRFGEAVGSTRMQHFAAFLNYLNKNQPFYSSGSDLFRTMEDLDCLKKLAAVKPELVQEPYTWYSETEYCYMHNSSGFFFAGKGGYNNESHNHNDMGSFILYLDQMPMIIDAGVGTYTRQTFSSERYSIWNMKSNYHNLPKINGIPEAFGSQYRSKNVRFDPAQSTFSLDLAGAYPDEAEVKIWQRTYKLGSRGLSVSDIFHLKEAKEPNQLNFLCWGKPDVSEPGTVFIEKNNVKLKLVYDKKQFKAVVETIELTDPRFSNVWGSKIYRLSLDAKSKRLSGKYTYKFEQF